MCECQNTFQCSPLNRNSYDARDLSIQLLCSVEQACSTLLNSTHHFSNTKALSTLYHRNNLVLFGLPSITRNTPIPKTNLSHSSALKWKTSIHWEQKRRTHRNPRRQKAAREDPSDRVLRSPRWHHFTCVSARQEQAGPPPQREQRAPGCRGNVRQARPAGSQLPAASTALTRKPTASARPIPAKGGSALRGYSRRSGPGRCLLLWPLAPPRGQLARATVPWRPRPRNLGSDWGAVTALPSSWHHHTGLARKPRLHAQPWSSRLAPRKPHPLCPASQPPRPPETRQPAAAARGAAPPHCTPPQCSRTGTGRAGAVASAARAGDIPGTRH